MEQPVNFSGVLPSAEAHFFDTRQMHVNNPLTDDGGKGSGINVPFPSTRHPDSGSVYWAESGLLKTYGPDIGTALVQEHESGIFAYNQLSSLFHVTGTRPVQADFDVFNPYVHHEAFNPFNTVGNTNYNIPISIPYIADVIISTPFYPYPF